MPDLTLEEKQAIASEMGRYYAARKVNARGGRPRTVEHTGEQNCRCTDCRKRKTGGPRGLAAVDSAKVKAIGSAGGKKRWSKGKKKGKK